MDSDSIDLMELEPRVLEWIDGDPDHTTAAELTDLLARANCDAPDMATGGRDDALEELADRFSQFLEFGTAGLRGTLGGGPNRMNRAVVIKTAAGLGNYLSEKLPDHTDIRVVIGFDARFGSRQFARDSAAVLTAQGKQVFLFEEHVPTPVLAFAIRQLRAEAAIMVTASHNPPQDNGYKVYLGGRLTPPEAAGVQIISPADREIAAHITATGPANAITRSERGWHSMHEELAQEYLTQLLQMTPLALTPDRADERSKLRIVYTPLHGVGGDLTRAALTQAGFLDVHVVSEQAAPDPEFPTVVFPNPEEPGAMDLALNFAQQIAADIIIANDPDADRCALAVRDAAGEFILLHGDEVGTLLAEHVAARAGGSGTLVSSLVSSRLSGKIAGRYGLNHQVTLTGFKWIARVPEIIYGYEEALGYCVAPEIVRDKDGISTAVLLASIIADLKTQGREVRDVLDDLARHHGLHVTDQLSARFVDRAEISRAVTELIENPPLELLGSEVVECIDLETGFQGLPATAGLWLRTRSDVRVVVRPSGTEPKLKCYLEVVLPVREDAPTTEVSAARETAGSQLADLKTELATLLGLR